MCHYSILPVIEADSLLRSSDREDEVADDFNSCMQDCLCPSPVMNTGLWEYIRCWAFCRFGGSGGSNSGSGTGTNGGGSNPYFGPVATGGVIPISGFINQGFGNGNTDGTGNGTGAGNPTNNNLANYNFEQTTFSLFDAYYECLADNPEVSTAVWNKLHTPQGTMHCLVPFLNEALSMLCMEAQGVSITAAQLEEEYVRALVYFYGIARTIEDYNFSFCEELGDVINFALLLDLTEMQFEYLLENPAFFDQIFNFVQSKGGSASSAAFASDVITQIMQHDLMFLTLEDLELLFEYPDFYAEYKQYLQQNPNASQEAKKIALRMVVEAPSKPIENLAERLNCFNILSNSNFTHRLTLYVDQPKANSNQSASSENLAGHTWIMLEQDQGNGTLVTLSVGLYPQTFASPCHQIDAGAYNDDEGHQFDVSVTWPITDWGFNNLVNDLKSQPFAPLYNLSSYNCSTFAVEKLNQLGLNIPATNVVSLDMPQFTNCRVEGLAPGQLGQDLRNNYPEPSGGGKNVIGGNAPVSSCQ